MAIEAPWRVIFADLLTNEIFGELPVSGTSFGSTLNDIGSFNGTLNMADPKVQQALGSAGGGMGGPLQEGRTAIWVRQDDTLVWGGILWTVSYDSPTKTVSLGGNEFLSYFSRRVISFSNGGVSGTYAFINTDVLAIVQSIMNDTQSFVGGNIGVIVPTETSGSLMTVSWDTTQNTSVLSAIQQCSQQSGGAGFDFAIDVSDINNYYKNLTLSYPRRGRVASQTGIVFDTGSKFCLGYTWPRDATAMADVVYGVGSGTGSTSLRATASDLTTVDAGYPLLEIGYSRSDIVSQQILDASTIAYSESVAAPVTLPTITMSLEAADPIFGSYVIGDDCRVVISPDEFFPQGFSGYFRIISWTVTPPEAGSAGNIVVTFGTPPVEFVGGGVVQKPSKNFSAILNPMLQRIQSLETTPAIGNSTIRNGALLIEDEAGELVAAFGDVSDPIAGPLTALQFFDPGIGEPIIELNRAGLSKLTYPSPGTVIQQYLSSFAFAQTAVTAGGGTSSTSWTQITGIGGGESLTFPQAVNPLVLWVCQMSFDSTGTGQIVAQLGVGVDGNPPTAIGGGWQPNQYNATATVINGFDYFGASGMQPFVSSSGTTFDLWIRLLGSPATTAPVAQANAWNILLIGLSS